MKTAKVVTEVLQVFVIPVSVFTAALCLAPQLQPPERLAFFSLMAQVLASMLIAFALLPHFQGTPAMHRSSLVLVGLGEACAIGGAVPTWSDHFWQIIFAITMAAASVALFAIVVSIGPANAQKQNDDYLDHLIQRAKRLDPDSP